MSSNDEAIISIYFKNLNLRYQYGRRVDQSTRHSQIGRKAFQKRFQRTQTDYRVFDRWRTDYRNHRSTGTGQIRF